MKKFLVAAMSGCALSAGLLGAAGAASAAPAQPASVAQTVAGLQSRGYTVIVNNAGATPLDACTMYAVRPGQTYSRMDSGFPGAGNDVITKVVSMTVYIDTDC